VRGIPSRPWPIAAEQAVPWIVEGFDEVIVGDDDLIRRVSLVKMDRIVRSTCRALL
jgi:hypothetical protein